MSVIANIERPVVSASSVPTNEYALLKRRIKQAGLLEKRSRYYLYKVPLTLGALLAGVMVLLFVHPMWLQVINALYLAIVMAQIGFLGHDAGHRQMFSATWKNTFAGLLFGNLLLGMSNAWWLDKHNQHHSHPNEIDMDPDLPLPGLCFNLQDARQKQGWQRFITRHQVWLFFPMLLLVTFDMGRSSFIFLRQNWRKVKQPWLELILVLAHWVLFPLLLVSCLGIGYAALFFVINKGVLGFILGSSFAPNHKGMPVLEKDSQLGFLHRQVLTSRNIRAGLLTDFWYGGLNYQIEHHLFPSMPRHNLRAAQVLVKQFCQERAISYTEASVPASYHALLQTLSEVSLTVRREE